MVISLGAYNSFVQANVQVLVMLLLLKPAVISLLLAALLRSPKRTLAAAYAPSLCDFSHKSQLPFAERCRIQQFLAAAPPPEKAKPEGLHMADEKPATSSTSTCDEQASEHLR